MSIQINVDPNIQHLIKALRKELINLILEPQAKQN